MDIFKWFLQTNASELALNLSLSLKLNNYLFIAYLVLSLLIKRSSFMMAFFVSCMLFEVNSFDLLSEADLYLLTFAIYSYVIFVIPRNRKATIACGILITLSIVLAYDAYFYGMNGAYGAHETVVYNNIEYLALYAHSIFISTLIPYRRIGDSLRRFFDSILYISRNSAYFTPV